MTSRPTSLRTPGGVAVILAAVGGVLFSQSFPPADLWFLLPVAIGLLVIASHTKRRSIAAVVAIVFGVCAFLPLFAWANIYAGLGPWAALAVFEACYLLLFALGSRAVLARWGHGLLPALAIGVLWAGTEAVRSHVPWGGLPWAASAFSLAHSPLLNLGPWIGVPGLAVVLGWMGAAVASCLLGLAGRRRDRLDGLGALLPLLTAALVIAASVVVPLPRNPSATEPRSLAVTAVQGNVKPPPPGSYYLPEEMFDNHVAATRTALSSRGAAASGTRPAHEPDLVVWPEDSTGWNAPSQPSRMAQVADLSRQAGAPILIGAQVPHGRDNRRNMAILVDENGPTAQQYAKRHPVPFGEYIPARGFFSRITDKVELVATDMVAGSEVGVMQVAGAPVGVLICFEIAYENLVQDVVADDAQMIVVQSNNALFGDSDEAIQQLAEAKVMAVVSGRSVVHISTVGHSAVFTPNGRTIASLDHWVAGSMQADVPLHTGITPAMRFGTLIRWAPVVGSAAVLVLLALIPERSPAPAQPSRTMPQRRRKTR
ncbi:apolipoprotein N-acyltransferase [Helcobacillus sp. ACRRO]|uniref:apolipoprotein N-acyltransferase n=1 Tax=Helcobacillus sp. ACRRO TaxID=2918202 RepID=UPI001EF73097|nr:apolipoprotein N-acyltransferase [Helcobacillus sp. ACRRO]